MPATAEQLKETYDYMLPSVVQALNPRDITAARFEGNYQLTLAQAQQAKHEHIFNRLGIFSRVGVSDRPRFLDIGCGFGSLPEAAENKGAIATGS